jgi:hypothetical protein
MKRRWKLGNLREADAEEQTRLTYAEGLQEAAHDEGSAAEQALAETKHELSHWKAFGARHGFLAPATCVAAMPLRPRALPAGFIVPCLPIKAQLAARQGSRTPQLKFRLAGGACAKTSYPTDRCLALSHRVDAAVFTPRSHGCAISRCHRRSRRCADETDS